jgi:hypothetical protein
MYKTTGFRIVLVLNEKNNGLVKQIFIVEKRHFVTADKLIVSLYEYITSLLMLFNER